VCSSGIGPWTRTSRTLQLGADRWIWGTPHGLYRLVTGGGTRPITQADYQLLAQDAVVLAEDYAA
jgi:hypothetical protein